MFFLWGHQKNSQTELWTSEDGIHFDYHSVSISAGNIGTRNATYSRMYEYPLKKYGIRSEVYQLKPRQSQFSRTKRPSKEWSTRPGFLRGKKLCFPRK